MKEREAYYITVNRQAVKVSREIYEEYYRGERKEKYFLHDLKEQRTKVDKRSGKMITVLSREDSYERLLETEKQFAEETESVEEIVIRSLLLKKLDQALQSLTKEEADMIYELYYQESSETELSVKLGIPRTTLRSRKEKILKKLKKLL